MQIDPAAETARLVDGLGSQQLALAASYTRGGEVLLVAGLAALLKTAEYRYPRPHPLEEALFYTHTSVERRVLRAMEWKAQHQSRRPEAPQ